MDRLKWKSREVRARRASRPVEGLYVGEKTVLARLFESESARNARLEAYFLEEPRGERDVEPILDRLEQQRGTWLREVLEACDE